MRPQAEAPDSTNKPRPYRLKRSAQTDEAEYNTRMTRDHAAATRAKLLRPTCKMCSKHGSDKCANALRGRVGLPMFCPAAVLGLADAFALPWLTLDAATVQRPYKLRQRGHGARAPLQRAP